MDQDFLTQYLTAKKDCIEHYIKTIKELYLAGRISKTQFSEKRQRVDLQLIIFRDLANAAGMAWDDLGA